ncbi:hypothetical protein [Nocardia sp. NPDC058705]|uniref:hypothetical protein n=1 Tax=Nocardia sp. NPDC058705 TaxID=3346609 RepID=UPI0036994BCB
MEPEEFVNIDRDCQRFLDLIREMQRGAEGIANTPPKDWGLGADNPLLTSAATMVSWFRDKAKSADGGNSVYAILEEHYRIVEDIQTVHKVIMERYIAADAEFAAEVRSLEASLGPLAPIAGAPAQATPETNPNSRHVSRGGRF